MRKSRAILALALVLGATACDPADARHRAAGTILFNQKKYAEALVEFEKAVQANPKEPGNHILVGNALVELGRTDEARAAYEEALRLDPRAGEAHRALAILVAQTAAPGDRAAYERFRAHIEAVVDANPKDLNALAAAGYTLSRYADPRDPDEYQRAQRRAEELFRQALAMDDRNPTILFNLALVYARKGDRDTALKVLDRLGRVDAQPGFATYGRAVVLAILGDADGALAATDELLKSTSLDPQSLQEDPLLQPLRSDPRFVALIDAARARKQGAE